MTDYISREALENWVREEVASLDSKEDREFVIQRWRKEIPAADVAPVVHGRWIKNDNGTWSCERCHSWIPNEQHYYARFCLYCGAKMDGGEEDGPVD